MPDLSAVNQLLFSGPLAVTFLAGQRMIRQGRVLGWQLEFLAQFGWVAWALTNPSELFPWFVSSAYGGYQCWQGWHEWQRRGVPRDRGRPAAVRAGAGGGRPVTVPGEQLTLWNDCGPSGGCRRVGLLVRLRGG